MVEKSVEWDGQFSSTSRFALAGAKQWGAGNKDAFVKFKFRCTSLGR